MDLFRLLAVRLILGDGARFHFFHGPALYAYVLDRLGRPSKWPRGLHIYPAESGRVHYGPGDAYIFGLVLRPDFEMDVAAFLSRLAGPPRTRYGQARGAPLGEGVRRDEVVDCVAGRRLFGRHSATFLRLEDVEEAAAPLVGRREIEVWFDTPLLIWRTPVGRHRLVLDGECFPLERFLERVAKPVAAAFPRLAPEGGYGSVALLANRMVRTDVRYPGKPLCGARGSVRLGFREGLHSSWARALVLAGVLGAGDASNMGQGRFRVSEAGRLPNWPPAPAGTLAQHAAARPNLTKARNALMKGGETPGVDEVTRDVFIESLTWRLDDLARRLASGDAPASPLRGILLEKPSGGVRGLAVPTFEDRFLQRACVEEIGSAVDSVLEDSSFAYRRGLSRRNAERSVRQAHDEGYRHVLDADMRSFFDLVDWDLLEIRLRAYFGFDPIVEPLLRWVKAPVEFAGKRVERTAGLPQGAVVSPLLANLYLDSFDEAMARHGFRLVRFADDFLVFGKSENDVHRAREAVQKELERLRLELSAGKTHETSFDRGFRFLGYLFCRSLVLESPGARARPLGKGEDVTWEEARELVPADAAGWLARVLEASPEEASAPEERWRRPIVGRAPARRPLYVIDPGLRVTGSRRGVRLLEGERLRAQVAWEKISEISVIGGRPIGASLFQHAMRRRVPVALYSRVGEPLGLVLPERVRSPAPNAYDQWRWHQNEPFRLAAARLLVETKIHNLRLLARYQPGDSTELRERLGELAGAALRSESLERLRGIEGQAAHVWFSRWEGWLAPSFGFPGRTGRGASDPINALLNFLYTQLFRACWMACLGEGLDPYLGVFHEGRGRYAALAADFQEPFRFLCDRLVLELVRRGQIAPEDFVIAEKLVPPARLKTEALRLVAETWERRLVAEVSTGGEKMSYRDHIFAQLRRFSELVRGERADLSPFRLKW